MALSHILIRHHQHAAAWQKRCEMRSSLGDEVAADEDIVAAACEIDADFGRGYRSGHAIPSLAGASTGWVSRRWIRASITRVTIAS